MAEPCLSCGACCASFRVDFHVADLETTPGGCVPVALTVPVTATLVRMRGTDASPARCVALLGEIGGNVACSIYGSRPSPCREFDTSHDACTRARARHGLPPLMNDCG